MRRDSLSWRQNLFNCQECCIVGFVCVESVPAGLHRCCSRTLQDKMAYAAGIQFTRALLLLLLLLLFVSLPFSLAQNCSYSYMVHPDAQGSCSALSSKDGFKSTTNLTELLTSMSSHIQENDCLQLSFYPGTYVISYNTILNYSAVFLAPSGNVNITCLSTCMSGRVTSSPLRFNGKVGAKFVMVDGVSFEDCQKPLQFDGLDKITISNSSFRWGASHIWG